MSDTLWRRMVVADGINWGKKMWFCRFLGTHQASFVFMPRIGNPDQYYPSHKCDICGKELF